MKQKLANRVTNAAEQRCMDQYCICGSDVECWHIIDSTLRIIVCRIDRRHHQVNHRRFHTGSSLQSVLIYWPKLVPQAARSHFVTASRALALDGRMKKETRASARTRRTRTGDVNERADGMWRTEEERGKKQREVKKQLSPE